MGCWFDSIFEYGLCRLGLLFAVFIVVVVTGLWLGLFCAAGGFVLFLAMAGCVVYGCLSV